MSINCPLWVEDIAIGFLHWLRGWHQTYFVAIDITKQQF